MLVIISGKLQSKKKKSGVMDANDGRGRYWIWIKRKVKYQ